MTKTTFRIRQPSMDDAQAVCSLVAACDIEDLGAPDIVLDDVLDMWSRFDLQRAPQRFAVTPGLGRGRREPFGRLPSL